MQKIYETADAALEGVLSDGMLIAAGGFGLCGIPELLIAAIRDAGTKDITVASYAMGWTPPGGIEMCQGSGC